MKIAVMGSGGVGGYFGARLAQGGSDVGFIARGAHLAALREKGLLVESKLGNISLPKVRVTDDPTNLGTVDVLLVNLADFGAAPDRPEPARSFGVRSALLVFRPSPMVYRPADLDHQTK